MINYTECLSLLMQDVVTRVEALSFINMADVLVFARQGRTTAEGAFATCHCLTLPPSEPGYYFWRDRDTGRVTRRSEWFVTKSPSVSIGSRPVKYMISFALPRFSDQTIGRSRKERFYPGKAHAWTAKLDTVVHELFHIDPNQAGIRRLDRGDGTYSTNCHSPRFFEQVAEMVSEYSARIPIRRRTIFSGTTSRRSSRASMAWSAPRFGRSRRIRSASSSACRTSRCARSTWTASRSSRSVPCSSRRCSRKTTCTCGTSCGRSRSA